MYISVRFGTKRIFDVDIYIYGTVCQTEYSVMDLSLKMGRMAQIFWTFFAGKMDDTGTRHGIHPQD